MDTDQVHIARLISIGSVGPASPVCDVARKLLR